MRFHQSHFNAAREIGESLKAIEAKASTIKVDGKVISTKPVFMASIQSNWNNSMQAYYPYVNLQRWVNGKVELEQISLGEHNNPHAIKIEYLIDQDQLNAVEAHIAKHAEEEERIIVRKGKNVEVIKGRKVKIGTKGRVFWLGNSGYGMSVGIELIDGSKVFTSLSNVKTI